MTFTFYPIAEFRSAEIKSNLIVLFKLQIAQCEEISMILIVLSGTSKMSGIICTN